MQAHMCMIDTRTAFHEYRSAIQSSPLLPPFACFPCTINYPFYLLGNPLFDGRGANIHPHSSLVRDQLPTPCSLPSPPNGSHSSCYMFSKTTSQHQLHCLIQVQIIRYGKVSVLGTVPVYNVIFFCSKFYIIVEVMSQSRT